MELASKISDLLNINQIECDKVDFLLNLVNETNVKEILTMLYSQINNKQEYIFAIVEIIEKLSKRIDVNLIKSGILVPNEDDLIPSPPIEILNKLISIGCEFNFEELTTIIFCHEYYGELFGDNINSLIYTQFAKIIENYNQCSDQNFGQEYFNLILIYLFDNLSFSGLGINNMFKLDHINFFKALVSSIDKKFKYSYNDLKKSFIKNAVLCYNHCYNCHYNPEYKTIAEYFSVHLQSNPKIDKCSTCEQKFGRDFEFINAIKLLMHDRAIELGDKKCARDLWCLGLLVN